MRTVIVRMSIERKHAAPFVIVVTETSGTILLTAGTKGERFALPNATIHMHQPLGGAQGQASDIEIQANEILRLKDQLNEILARHTGQSVETIVDDTNRDYYMDAYGAVDYGLVDRVTEVPEFKQVLMDDAGGD